MNRLSRFYFASLVAMFLLMPALSWATWEVIDCPVDRGGYITAGYLLGDEEHPVNIEAHSHTTPIWGKRYSRPPMQPGATEYRAYLGFDTSAAELTPGRRVRKAEFFYGPGTWVSGGPSLPTLWRVELYGSLANPNNLFPADWNGPGDTYAGQINFGTPPTPVWISLPQSFVDHFNFYGGQTMELRDVSHSSQDGFYSAIPRGCILRLTIEDLGTGGKSAGDLNAGESTATASSTISNIKALY